jgi:hypothetical protein
MLSHVDTSISFAFLKVNEMTADVGEYQDKWINRVLRAPGIRAEVVLLDFEAKGINGDILSEMEGNFILIVFSDRVA